MDKLYLMVAVTLLEQFDAKSIPAKAKVEGNIQIMIDPFKQNFKCKNAIIFLLISLNIYFGCSKELSRRDRSFEHPQYMF